MATVPVEKALPVTCSTGNIEDHWNKENLVKITKYCIKCEKIQPTYENK